MNDSNEQPHRQSLPVLPNSGKVEQLRKQADALPKHSDTNVITRFVDPNKTPKQKAIEEKIVSAIRTIYDPEIPVNIYDLGLIYAIDIDAQTSNVRVKMTLTAPGCPVAGELVAQVQRCIETIDEVAGVEVELVWEPAWSRQMMSETAQLELGL